MRLQILSAMFLLAVSIAFTSEIERVVVQTESSHYAGQIPAGVFLGISIARTNALDVSPCELLIDPGDHSGLKRLIIQPFRTPERLFHQYKRLGTYRLVARAQSGCTGEKGVDVVIEQGTRSAGASFGGAEFQRKCPPGEALVGIAGRTSLRSGTRIIRCSDNGSFSD